MPQIAGSIPSLRPQQAKLTDKSYGHCDGCLMLAMSHYEENSFTNDIVDSSAFKG